MAGSKFITPSASAYALNVDLSCRNFSKVADTTRMTTNHRAAQAIESGANNRFAYGATRVHFCRIGTFNNRIQAGESSEPNDPSATDLVPSFNWTTDDSVVNGEYRYFHCVRVPRESVPGSGDDAYFQRTDNSIALDSGTIGPKDSGAKGAAPVLGEWVMEWALYDRGTAPGSRRVEGLATFGDLGLISCIVQDRRLGQLDTEKHNYIPTPPGQNDPILGAQFLERVRSKIHSQRSTNLPIVVSWSAMAQLGDYPPSSNAPTLTANTGSKYGLYSTDENNWRNLLKMSSTSASPSFSQTGPGWPCPVRYHGVGTQSVTNGKKLKVDMYVLARATGQDGSVQFIGPSTFASNTTTIPVTTAGGLAWYGDSSTYVYLDTSVAHTDTSTSRPKIDGWCKVDSAGGHLYVYAVRGLAVYGL